MKRSTKVSAGVLCGLALVTLVVALSRQPAETISFQIVDYVTGKPIRGATVEVFRTWTRLPIEQLPFVGDRINLRYHRTIQAETGDVKITGVPKLDPSGRIVLRAKGYENAFVEQQPVDECSNPDVYRILYFPAGGNAWLQLHDSAYEYVNRKQSFTVALEPSAGGTQRGGARYLTTPSPGSKEKAIITAKRRAAEWQRKDVEVKDATFRNGHWEVTLLRLPAGPGNQTWFDIADDGQLLGIHPTE